jgi:hypothetical protein
MDLDRLLYKAAYFENLIQDVLLVQHGLVQSRVTQVLGKRNVSFINNNT